MPPLLPAESSRDYLEGLLAGRSGRPRLLYPIVLALIAAGLAALPLVRVPVTVRARGVIRPVLEKQEILAPVAGVVERAAVTANAAVRAGEPLVVLRSGEVGERLRIETARLREARDRISDLERLLSSPPAEPDAAGLRTERYAEEASRYLRAMRAARALERHAGEELARARALGELGLVARSDVDARQAELDQRGSEVAEVSEGARSRWRSELADARREAGEAAEREGAVAEERALHVVRAPVAGTLSEVASLVPGSYVGAGSRIAVLSPSAALFAEVLVPPRDVGLLRRGTTARLQLDAFRPADWGVLTGRILDLPADLSVVDQQPVYRVPVTLDRRPLRLRNGRPGEVRKGMTLTARFVVTRRSLLQLLRDDVADWLDPDGATPDRTGHAP